MNNELRTKIASAIGFLAGGLLSVFGKSSAKTTTDDLRQMDFKTSAQRLGVRFTEKIRQVFRFRWIRKS